MQLIKLCASSKQWRKPKRRCNGSPRSARVPLLVESVWCGYASWACRHRRRRARCSYRRDVLAMRAPSSDCRSRQPARLRRYNPKGNGQISLPYDGIQMKLLLSSTNLKLVTRSRNLRSLRNSPFLFRVTSEVIFSCIAAIIRFPCSLFVRESFSLLSKIFHTKEFNDLCY